MRRHRAFVIVPVSTGESLVRNLAMAEDNSISIDEWLDHLNDLDAYLANGGPLLDLPISSLEMVPESIVQRMVKRITQERLKKFGRFRERLETQGAADAEADAPAPQPQDAQQADPAAAEAAETRAA